MELVFLSNLFQENVVQHFYLFYVFVEFKQ